MSNGPGSFKHTEKTDRRICDAYERGERLRDVAAELGVSRNTIIGRARILSLARAGRQIEAAKKFNKDSPGNPEAIRRWMAANPDRVREIAVARNAGRDRYWASRKVQKADA
jgi:hypothetical protein